MKLLLDTHILIWWLSGSPRLGRKALSEIVAPNAILSVSAATWWEIGIKRSLGRLQFDWAVGKALLASNRIAVLPVTFEHGETAADLPRYHDDPFDRMLVAQAQCEGVQLLTRDKKLKAYGSVVLCV